MSFSFFMSIKKLEIQKINYNSSIICVTTLEIQMQLALQLKDVAISFTLN